MTIKNVTLLRQQLFTALATLGVVSATALGCDASKAKPPTPESSGSGGLVSTGSATTPTTSPTATANQCAFGKPATQCWPVGQVPDHEQENLPPKVESQHKKSPLDANGCPTAIDNSCCNPSEGAPTLVDGQCCYVFCAGSCCGRPFHVDGAMVTAPSIPRTDWMLSGASLKGADEDEIVQGRRTRGSMA